MHRPDDIPKRHARWRLVIPVLVTAVALVAACSSTDEAGRTGGSPVASAPEGTSGATPGSQLPAEGCEPPDASPVAATPVPGVASDLDIESFDGTRIRTHWFPLDDASAAAPRPTVLMGPGWGLPGDTAVESVGVLGALNIGSLRDAGYNVLTWDPRGFGQSGGSAEVDSVDFEARDVQQLLNWLATMPEVQLDGPGDPTAGMVGGSYGGGIQLVTAAIDCRVDALVPVVAWHSLGTSLYKSDTFKQGWATILSGVTATASVDPHVASANASATSTGRLSEEDRDWFLDRGPAQLVEDITAPTLVVGGTVDTLFTLDEDITNFQILRDNGVPTAMYWFCGGHGACLTEPGDPARMQSAIISWLDRYVKGDEGIDTGPRFQLLDQNGVHYVADDYPTGSDEADPIVGSGSGELELVAEGGAGPSTAGGGAGLLDRLVGPITPARATNAVDVEVTTPGSSPQLVLGAPTLSATYRGTVADGERPTRVFAQLVDDATGLVLGNQITPIPVTLDGEEHEVRIPLEVVVFHATPRATVTLQLVATTTAYGQPRLGGAVTFSAIEVSLPVVTGVMPG